MRLTNWAGNVTFSASTLHRPSTVAELRRIVAATERIRPLGTRHSFSPIADSPGDLVSLADLPAAIEIDSERAVARVSGGVRYGELATTLADRGWALHNLGSLPHISVAGACATGTHGSGDANGNLATAVSALRLVTADGELVTVRRGEADFAGMVVALGALGVVAEAELDIQPSFTVRQDVYDDLPTATLLAHFDEIFAAGYSVSAFTDWRGDRFMQVWRKRRTESTEPAPAEWFGARLADGPRHPVPGMRSENCTQQQGIPGPWHERLPHFRLAFTPSSGTELQTEYLVGRAQATGALRELDAIRDRIAPVLQTSELRTIAEDDLWLSPSYGRPSLGFHFTWIDDPDAVRPVCTAIEERLAPFGARPHWGKVFTMAPQVLSPLYERLPDFQELRRRLDPKGKFRNALLDEYLPLSP